MFYHPLILALAGLIGSGANPSQPPAARGNPPAQPGAQNPITPPAQTGTPVPLPKPPQTDNKNPVDDGGILVQSRGPLHEAFAQPVDLNPTPTTPVPKAPPPAVPELPPGEKPAGANVQWIPGYWGWDPDKNDFLWVSGVWPMLRQTASGLLVIGTRLETVGSGRRASGAMPKVSRSINRNHPIRWSRALHSLHRMKTISTFQERGSNKTGPMFGVRASGIRLNKIGCTSLQTIPTRRLAPSTTTDIGTIHLPIAGRPMLRSSSTNPIGPIRVGIISRAILLTSVSALAGHSTTCLSASAGGTSSLAISLRIHTSTTESTLSMPSARGTTTPSSPITIGPTVPIRVGIAACTITFGPTWTILPCSRGPQWASKGLGSRVGAWLLER